MMSATGEQIQKAAFDDFELWQSNQDDATQGLSILDQIIMYSDDEVWHKASPPTSGGVDMAFGHSYASGPDFHMDTWGKGPLLLRFNGRKWIFEYSDMFGPALLRRDGYTISDRQPVNETHPFWAAFEMWQETGMRHRAVKDKRGKVRFYACYCPPPKGGTNDSPC